MIEKKKLLRNLCLLVGLILFALWFALHKDLEGVKDVLSQLDLFWGVGIVCLGVLFYILAGVHLTWIARTYEPDYTYRGGMLCAFSGALFNGITPLGCGQVAQTYVLHKQKLPMRDCLGVLMLDFMVFQVVILLYAASFIIWALIERFAFYQTWLLLIFAGFCVNLFVIGVLWTLAFFPHLYHGIFQKGLYVGYRFHIIKDLVATKAHWDEQIVLFQEQMLRIRTQKKLLLKLFLLQVARMGIFYQLPLCAALALHLPITPSFVWESMFTSTSAVCVTGLISIDTAEHFNVFGRAIVAALIQIGGLGVTSVGAAFILLAQRKLGLRSRILIKEGLNLNSLKGVVRLVKSVLKLTLLFEGIGIILSFIVFVQDYDAASALGIAVFHSISAFNNSGFDILGGLTNLIPYQSNVLLNLTTCGLIIFGGLGFCVIQEIWQKRKWKQFSMNTKIVVTMTIALLAIGTLLLKLCEDVTWLGAFFQSTSARTAGFSTYPLGSFTNTGLFVLIILMFIGASPGSTGGGIKTTTTFTIIMAIKSLATNRSCVAFQRKIPWESILKAFVIMTLALSWVCGMTAIICVLEPNCTFIQILFEVVSGFGTVGLSTGITPELCDVSKLLLSATMFFGRLGPLTIACLWSYQMTGSHITYAEEQITIG